MPQFQTLHRPAAPSRMAVRFILVSAGVYAACLSLAAALIHFLPPRVEPGRVVFPPAFWLTTVLLAVGSGCLQYGVSCVRIERQKPFRRSLVIALVSGTLFVGIQIYGLQCLIRNQRPDEVQTGANAFIVMLGGLHAMHFSLALLFLVWVTLSALADRYDHEYSWGVTVCAWFWHGLGMVWLCILVIFAIACVPGLFAVR
ncbi:MAG: cytochrome c oxidase subunit 3 [Deltaproteobacteria bacterium]